MLSSFRRLGFLWWLFLLRGLVCGQVTLGLLLLLLLLRKEAAHKVVSLLLLLLLLLWQDWLLASLQLRQQLLLLCNQ
jgi:hypothetical protein